MKLWIMSAVATVLALALQATDWQWTCDCIGPLLAGVGLAAPRARSVAWAALMALLWSPITDVSPLVLAGIWCGCVLLLHGISRSVEWQQPLIAFVIAAGTSLLWQISTWFVFLAEGGPMIISRAALSALIVKPLTAGAMFVALFHTIVACAGTRREYLRWTHVQRQRHH